MVTLCVCVCVCLCPRVFVHAHIPVDAGMFVRVWVGGWMHAICNINSTILTVRPVAR